MLSDPRYAEKPFQANPSLVVEIGVEYLFGSIEPHSWEIRTLLGRLERRLVRKVRSIVQNRDEQNQSKRDEQRVVRQGSACLSSIVGPLRARLLVAASTKLAPTILDSDHLLHTRCW